MTQNEIIRMANDAARSNDPVIASNEFLERFAALVAEATKEKAAKVCEEMIKGEGLYQAEYCAAAIRSMK